MSFKDKFYEAVAEWLRSEHGRKVHHVYEVEVLSDAVYVYYVDTVDPEYGDEGYDFYRYKGSILDLMEKL